MTNTQQESTARPLYCGWEECGKEVTKEQLDEEGAVVALEHRGAYVLMHGGCYHELTLGAVRTVLAMSGGATA